MLCLSKEYLLPSYLSGFVSGGGVPQSWPDRDVCCPPFAARALSTTANSSGELSKSSFLLVIFGSGEGNYLGEAVFFVPPLGDASSIQGVVQSCREYCFCQLKPDEILEGIFF